jgi:hypothetical protein
VKILTLPSTISIDPERTSQDCRHAKVIRA